MTGDILGATIRTVQANPVEIGLETLQTFGLGGVCYYLIKYISEDRKRDMETHKQSMEMVADAIGIATNHQGTLERLCDKIERVEDLVKPSSQSVHQGEAGPGINHE